MIVVRIIPDESHFENQYIALGILDGKIYAEGTMDYVYYCMAYRYDGKHIYEILKEDND